MNIKLSVWLRKSENIIAFLAIALLAFFPAAEVVARKFFSTGIQNSLTYTHHLVLLVTFIGGMITSREGSHLCLSLDIRLKPGIRRPLDLITTFLSTAVLTALAWSSLSFAKNGFSPAQKIGPFPLWITGAIMGIGYFVMALRVNKKKSIPFNGLAVFFGLIGGTLAALEPLANLYSGLTGEFSGTAAGMVDFIQPLIAQIAWPVIILLIFSAFFGVSIFVVLGGIAYFLFARMGQPLEVIPNEAYSMLISHSLPAIPLFTVTGFILSESRAGERLVKLFQALFAWIPGGLAIMGILVCAFFTTFTGASGVTILALGALLAFVLNKGGYKKEFNTGLLTASGSVGLLFPPSLPIIIYGVAAQVSIRDMFLGGIVPGMVMIAVLVVFAVWYALKRKIPREKFKLKPALAAVKESIWEIFLPVIILVAYFGGLTTLVESSALAVVYAFLVEFAVKRDLKLRDMRRVLSKSIPIVGGVLSILALAKGLSYFIVDVEIPMKLTSWVQLHIGSKYVFLLLLNVVLLITGCLMDIFSAIMVVVPLILPLGQVFGIHPVHLGIIFLANMELGYLTPPVGLNLFLASYRFNEPLGSIYRRVIPFFFIQLASVLLITYVPVFSTGLLSLFGD